MRCCMYETVKYQQTDFPADLKSCPNSMWQDWWS